MLTFEYSAKNPDASVAYCSFEAMHTVMETVIVGLPESIARAFAEDIYNKVAGINAKFNRFDPESIVARINAGAFSEPVTVDEETYLVLELANAFWRGTCGFFDVTAANDTAAERGYDLNPKTRTVRSRSRGTRVDLGGFAKGYALEKIREMSNKTDVTDVLLNFGNSSVLGIGKHPYGDAWPVGIAYSNGHECDFRLNNSALSVSGMPRSGVRHIINPLTGTYAGSDEMIAVQGRSALVCEILSTALYAAPPAQRAAIMNNFEGYQAVSLRGTGEKVRIA